MFLANSLPGEIFHPVPIALGEIRKLCQSKVLQGVGDFELIGEACRIPDLEGLRQIRKRFPPTA